MAGLFKNRKRFYFILQLTLFILFLRIDIARGTHDEAEKLNHTSAGETNPLGNAKPCADWADGTFLDPNRGPEYFCAYYGNKRGVSQNAWEQCSAHADNVWNTLSKSGGPDRPSCKKACVDRLHNLCQGESDEKAKYGLGTVACLEMRLFFLPGSAFCGDLSKHSKISEKTQLCHNACNQIVTSTNFAKPPCKEVSQGKCTGKNYQIMIYQKDKIFTECSKMMKEGCSANMGAANPVVAYCKRISGWDRPYEPPKMSAKNTPEKGYADRTCWDAIVRDCNQQGIGNWLNNPIEPFAAQWTCMENACRNIGYNTNSGILEVGTRDPELKTCDKIWHLRYPDRIATKAQSPQPNNPEKPYWDYPQYARSPKYGDHVKGSEELLNFTFVDWGDQGIHAYPGMDTKLFMESMGKDAAENKFGFILNSKGKPIGITDKSWNAKVDAKVAVQECALCHVGKAAGQIIVGLGNKRYDAGYNGQMGTKFTLPNLLLRPRLGTAEERKSFDEMLAKGNEFSQRVVDKQNLTQGLVPIGVANSRLVYEQGEDASFLPRAQAKVPAIWGYGPKRESGQGVFMDGFGDAKIAGWGAAFPISGAVSNDWVVKHVDRLERIEAAFAKILPPPYPFAVDKEKAERGKLLFQNNCARCHGSYQRDSDGVPIYGVPKLIPYDKIGTDLGRSGLISPRMADYVKRSSLSPVMKIARIPDSIYAPRLEAIWARYPYLHNASIPSLYSLLTPSERPDVFPLKDAGEKYRYDVRKMGLTVEPNDSLEFKALLKAGKEGARDVYYKDRAEHGNHGHEFGTDLSQDEKFDLIEYLKTL